VVNKFEQALSDVRFWDRSVEQQFKELGAPIADAALQIRAEAVAFCEWIEANQIKSYMEIGIWTGRFITALHEIFKFERIAACDLEAAQSFGLKINLPPETNFFKGSSLSPIFSNWAENMGEMDLVLIDTDHTFDTLRRNFEINYDLGAKHIAMCGISKHHRGISGVRAIWEELPGKKTEILKPHSEIGLDHSTIGIGIWSSEDDV
jgi:hypothetical protein